MKVEAVFKPKAERTIGDIKYFKPLA